MKTNGELHLFDYKTKQIIATVQQHEYISDLRHWEVKDSVDLLDVTLLESSPYIPLFQQQNIILRETRSGYMVPYVITEKAGDSKAGTVTFYAQGDWTLLDKDDFFAPQKLTSLTATSMLNHALLKTDYEVGIVEVLGSKTLTLDTFMSPLRVIREIRTLWGDCELRYRAEVTGAQIFKRYVDLIVKRGSETAKEIILGKDLNGIVRRENSADLITALIPFVEGTDENSQRVLTTIESVNNGVPYIVDEQAFQRWNMNGKHRFGFYTPQTDDDKMTPTRLLSLGKTELKKRINTSVIYEVDAVDISSVSGFTHEQVAEGDTLRIIDEGFTPTLYLEARAIGGDESHKDVTANKYTFGEYREVSDPNEALRKLYQQMLSQIQDKVPAGIFEALKDKVNQQGSIIDNANSKSQEALQESKEAKDIADASLKYAKENTVEIIEQPTPPTTGLKDGKTLWSDNSDPNNKVLKLWKGGAWVIITPDTKLLNQALTDTLNDITKAKQDIISGQNALTSAKSELQGNINTEKQRITDLTTTVGKKVDKTWIDQQLLDKADKSGVYTRDYIDQNTVGKQAYETDQAGNVKKFTDMSTDITRNANAIKSKAEQSSLDTTNNNMTGVTNRVTTVEQTATGLTNRMTSAEGKINTATGNITDLQTKTNTIEQTANGSAQKITELTGQFTQKTNEIINTVEQNAQKLTSVETTMKNAKYGRDNLIPNSGMFSNTVGWMANTPVNSTMEVVTEDGFNAMKIKGSIRTSNPITLKPDTEYVYSAMIKLPIEQAISEGSGNPLHFWSTIGANPHTAVQRAILEPASKKIIANTWTRVSYKFKTVAGTENTLFTPFIYSQEIINSNAFAYVRYFQLIEGNQITEDWQAPSGDIIKKTNELTQTIDGTISRVSSVENRRTGSDNLLKIDSARWVVAPKNTGSDGDNYNYANLPVNMQMDRTYTVSARVKFTAGTDTHISVYPYPNGSQQHIEIKDGFITHTFKKTNASTVGILLYAGKSATTRSKGVEFTEIMVTEGDGVVAYAPPSPTLDAFTSKTNEITQTVDANKQKISSVESTVSAINDDVTNLFMDAGSFKGYSTTYDSLQRWLLKGAGARISADTFLDNAVAETQSSWSSLCYNFKDLADRGVVKVGDILNVSIYMRIKGLPAGQTKIVSYFFRGRNNAKSFNVSNTWARYDVETTVTADMLTVSGAVPDSYMRFEVNENTGGTAWFQQSQPQLTIGTKLYTWRTAPEDISTLVVRTNEISNTVDSNMMTITKAVQGGGENFLYKSSGEKGEVSVLHDDASYTFNGATRNANNMDHIQIVCSSYSDAFYQIGATNVNLMHGFSAGETLTLSFDQKQDLTGMQTIIFQHDGTSWSEAEAKTYSQLSWSRESHTFTLKPNTKGWFIRFRFPRVAEANTKNIWLAKLKLEPGSIKSPWSANSIETMRTQNTLKQDVDSLSSNITSVSNRAGALETKSNNLQQSIDGTISKVNTLTTTQTNQGTQITQQGTQITQMNNQIDLRVKTTEMTDYIGKLGAENELRNTSFETKVIHPTGIITSRTPSLDKWGGARPSGSSVVADTVRNREGYNSAKIEDLVSTTNQYCGINQSIPATISSGDYVASVWVYTDDKSKINQGAQLYLQFMNGATAVSGGAGADISSSLVNGQWKLFTVKVTAPATTITALRFEVWVRQQGRIWVSQPMLQYGSNPSAFMEHPQDYVNYDALVGEVAKKVATTDYNTKIQTIESSISQSNQQISLRVLATDVYKKTEADGRFGSKAIVDTHESSINLLQNQITLKVEAGGIASAINQTAQAVLIQANKIYLDGYVEGKHIKANMLQGVTIMTVDSSSAENHMRLEKQNLTLYGTQRARGFLGFVTKSNGSYTEALVLGNNFTGAGGTVNDSLVIDHTTANATNFDNSVASIGLASGRDANGGITKSSYIEFRRYMNAMKINSEGELAIRGLGRVDILADGSNSIGLRGHTAILETDWGDWRFTKDANQSSKTTAQLLDNDKDVEWVLNGRSIRVTRSGYGDNQWDFYFTRGTASYNYAHINANNGWFQGTVSGQVLEQRSSRDIKTNIKDIQVDPLEEIMKLKPRQYNFKEDVNELYNRRVTLQAEGSTETLTTNDIALQYGFIVDETAKEYVGKSGKSVVPYAITTMSVASIQQIRKEQLEDKAQIDELKCVLISQEDRIAKLEELLLQQLINKKQEQQ
ncbi:phage tail spike protein (plasmid) [Bacillus toyonensis]